MTFISKKQGNVSRRDFLKMLGAASSFAIIPPGFTPLGTEQLVSPAAETQVYIPPSLMLHSPDGRADFLPPLLDGLHQAGFTTTTYQTWYRAVLANRPILNPVILSIDDLTLVRNGSAAFNTFVQMKDWIKAAGGTAVYGIITTPVIGGQAQREQDEAQWDRMQSWVEDGFELATHTAYHSNFNALDTEPRPDFSAVDYEAEIVGSAQLIETKMAERDIDYRVETLILPFGSGYAYDLPKPAIHPGIVDACHQTNIKFVIGIPQGREPIQRDRLNDSNDLLYLGRIPPAYFTDPDGHRTPQAAQTLSWLQNW